MFNFFSGLGRKPLEKSLTCVKYALPSPLENLKSLLVMTRHLRTTTFSTVIRIKKIFMKLV